jgi:CubicO group peptidase (beta-lactamase class C family)
MAEDRIRAALETGLADSGLPGVAVAALTTDGREINLAAGVRGVADPVPMAPDSIFWIASMTKAVTSVVALQLVAEGRLILEDPVGRWLPELADPQVLEGFDDAGAPRLRPAAGPVTLRGLLTHTAGLAYDFASPGFARWVAHSGASMMGQDPPKGVPLMFDPGSDWAYGHNTDFVGRLIEAVTGEPLEAVFRTRVFAPLGMPDTGFTLTAAQRTRLAPMHARMPGGVLAPIPFAMPDPPYFQQGGGGLHSTPGDYLKFLSALLGQGPALLPPDLLSRLTTSEHAEPRPGVIASSAPHMSNDFDAFPGQPTGWSLGFLVNLEQGPAGRAAGSLAWAGLSNCYYWLDPQHRVAGVLMAQLLPFADPGVLGLFDRFERAVYGA